MALVIVLAGVLVANVIPDGPTGHLAYAQTTDSSIEFTENGTSPVVPFFAYDQDGDAIVWSLSGPDADQFTIDDGVLAFREPPNYEDPQAAATGVPLAERNVYHRGGRRHARRGRDGHRRGRGRNGEHEQAATAGRPALRGQPIGRG